MKTINIKEKFKNWKLGNYFRELSIVIAGVFVTLAGTDFISVVSQERQIEEAMHMIQLELKENLQAINVEETEYLNEISFFKLLVQKQDSLRKIDASVLIENANAPFRASKLICSEDALEVLKSSALMQQITDKQFILKLLQTYKYCRIIKEDIEDYYEYKAKHQERYMNRNDIVANKQYENIYDAWENRLKISEIRMIVWNMPYTFDENPFTTPKIAIREMVQLIEMKY